MKITSISDIHGFLVEDLPPADVLTISGDLVPANWKYAHIDPQNSGFSDDFIPWCNHQISSGRFKNIVFIAGNHDAFLERTYHRDQEEHFRSQLPEGVYYLRDDSVEIGDVVFYGTPWSPPFMNWSFMASENELAEIYGRIPEFVDILLTHTPPLGFGDSVHGQSSQRGSESLLKQLETSNPLYNVFGHIHSGSHAPQGVSGTCTTCANVSLVNEAYDIVYSPFQFEV